MAGRAGRLRRCLEAARQPHHQAARALDARAGGVRCRPERRPARRPAGPGGRAAAALRGAGVGACVAGPGARTRRRPRPGRRTPAGPHRRPARVRGGHARRLPGDAGRPGTGGR